MNESIIASRIPYSKLRGMFDAAQELEKNGCPVIHMELGRPDFRTPDHIVRTAIDALERGEHHYCPNAGIIELRKAISARHTRDFSITWDTASEILVTNGVSEGIFLAIKALLNPGDQILVPDPTWMNYAVDAQMAFVEPIAYSLDEKFQPDIDKIERLITPRTKMLVMVSPANPTGAVLTSSSVEALARLAQKHDLVILSDEIYEKVIYPPAEFHSPATLPDMKERCIVLNGFSKYYSMTGWRLGYVLAPRKYLNPMLRFHQYALSSVATFSQFGAVAALEGTQEPSQKMVAEFRRRRDYIHARINEAGLDCELPDGAFYLFPSIKNTGLGDDEFVMKLLNEAHVVAAPGNTFGRAGEGHIRLSYACSMEDLEIAARNIKKFLRG